MATAIGRWARFSVAVAGLCLSGAGWATAQTPDRIVVDGKQESLFENPLATLQRNDRISELGPGNCTSNWRGYRADWEIRDRKLWLVAVHTDVCSEKPTDVPLKTLFPESQGPVHASWYTGRLVVPRGKLRLHLHMGYESRYERYLLVQVRDGRVEKQEEVDEIPGRPRLNLPR